MSLSLHRTGEPSLYYVANTMILIDGRRPGGWRINPDQEMALDMEQCHELKRLCFSTLREARDYVEAFLGSELMTKTSLLRAQRRLRRRSDGAYVADLFGSEDFVAVRTARGWRVSFPTAEEEAEIESCDVIGLRGVRHQLAHLEHFFRLTGNQVPDILSR